MSGPKVVKLEKVFYISESLDIAERIQMAANHATEAFWDIVVQSFPEAECGDFFIPDTEKTAFSWVKHWVKNNVSTAQSLRGPLITNITLHYKDTWHLLHTGGGCMVAVTDNVVVDGKYAYLAVSSDAVAIYIDSFNANEFLTLPVADWVFGANPTTLMNIIDIHFGGAALWNTSHLFDDIMTIGKSDLV